MFYTTIPSLFAHLTIRDVEYPDIMFLTILNHGSLVGEPEVGLTGSTMPGNKKEYYALESDADLRSQVMSQISLTLVIL